MDLEHNTNPVLLLFFLQSHKDLHFVHVRQGGLYWVATTTAADSSPFTIIEFLNRCVFLISMSFKDNIFYHIFHRTYWKL